MGVSKLGFTKKSNNYNGSTIMVENQDQIYIMGEMCERMNMDTLDIKPNRDFVGSIWASNMSWSVWKRVLGVSLTCL